MDMKPEPVPPCPKRPNCVCSRDDAPRRNRLAPLAFEGNPEAAFARFREIVVGLPRTTVAEEAPGWFRAVCRTRIGFADDLEARLCPEEGVIHVRSASRLGWSDMGVNRRRVEELRRRFEERD